MTDSFVFYKSFYEAIKKLPTIEEKWEAISSLMELGYYDIEPDLTDASDMVQVIYILGEKQIKASVKHKIDGLKGGRPKKDGLINVKNPPFKNIETNANVNVNVNDNVNANANANHFTPPQENYCKDIFSLFKNAKLPCARNNEISFLQTDFKNALVYIHNTPELQNFTSQDITEAVKNYITVLNDPGCYVSAKMDFFTLVKSKIFYKLLPSNFDIENFKKFDSDKAEPQEKEVKPEKIKTVYSSKPCPDCKAKKLEWQPFNDLFVCHACNKTFYKNEIEGGKE